MAEVILAAIVGFVSGLMACLWFLTFVSWDGEEGGPAQGEEGGGLRHSNH
jgi:hypothetical protein